MDLSPGRSSKARISLLGMSASRTPSTTLRLNCDFRKKYCSTNFQNTFFFFYKIPVRKTNPGTGVMLEPLSCSRQHLKKITNWNPIHVCLVYRTLLFQIKTWNRFSSPIKPGFHHCKSFLPRTLTCWSGSWSWEERSVGSSRVSGTPMFLFGATVYFFFDMHD